MENPGFREMGFPITTVPNIAKKVVTSIPRPKTEIISPYPNLQNKVILIPEFTAVRYSGIYRNGMAH